MISNTVELAVTAVLFGAVGIFSPTRFALSVLMLTGERSPWARSVAFAIASTVVFAVAALIGLVGGELSGIRDVSSEATIVIGLLIVAVAVIMLVRRRRLPDEIPPTSSRRPLLAAAGIGAGVSVQSFGRLLILVAGGTRIGLLSTNPVESLATLGAMIAIWQIPVLAPMALYIFARPRFDAIARRARPAIDRVEGGPWAAILVAAVGFYLIVRGLLA